MQRHEKIGEKINLRVLYNQALNDLRKKKDVTQFRKVQELARTILSNKNSLSVSQFLLCGVVLFNRENEGLNNPADITLLLQVSDKIKASHLKESPCSLDSDLKESFYILTLSCWRMKVHIIKHKLHMDV